MVGIHIAIHGALPETRTGSSENSQGTQPVGMKDTTPIHRKA
jgi:hypothetical protein